MGVYLNPGNEQFTASVSSELYVDKTELITAEDVILKSYLQDLKSAKMNSSKYI